MSTGSETGDGGHMVGMTDGGGDLQGSIVTGGGGGGAGACMTITGGGGVLYLLLMLKGEGDRENRL